MQQTTTEERPRRRGVSRLAEVVAVEKLTEHMVRVHFGGEQIAAFLAEAAPEKLASTDKYVKMLFGSDDAPSRRTYTVRSVDAAEQTIAIDFVVHGDEGIAGPWAAAAQVGDTVTLSGPGGGYAPSDDDGVFHLLIGDDSALPAIGAALEALPDTARGLALLEIADAADRQEWRHPAGVAIRWLHRAETGGAYGEPIADAVAELAPITGDVQVFAHGERGAIKRIRATLTDVWHLERSAMSISAYWARGRAEDAFQAEKRGPVGEI